MIEQLNLTGVLLGFCTFVIIGLFHPLVVKGYYYFGTGCWRWFLLLGLCALAGSVIVDSILIQTILGVFAFSSFWSIKEVFEQRRRVEKGWFPANPSRPEQRARQRQARTETPSGHEGGEHPAG